jgi:hypothetical protein
VISVIGFFLGRSRPRFIGGGIVGSAGLVSSRVSSEVDKRASSLFSLSLLAVLN